MSKFKVKPEPLADEIARRVAMGREGAVCISRSPEDGTLRLRTGARMLRVLKLSIHLDEGGQDIDENEEAFTGILYLDDHGDDMRGARMVLLDEARKPVMASDFNIFRGHIFFVAASDEKEMRALAYSALFQLSTDQESSRSAAMWDSTPAFLFYADVENDLLGSADGRACS